VSFTPPSVTDRAFYGDWMRRMKSQPKSWLLGARKSAEIFPNDVICGQAGRFIG